MQSKSATASLSRNVLISLNVAVVIQREPQNWCPWYSRFSLPDHFCCQWSPSSMLLSFKDSIGEIFDLVKIGPWTVRSALAESNSVETTYWLSNCPLCDPARLLSARVTDRCSLVKFEHGVDRLRERRTTAVVDAARIDPNVLEPLSLSLVTASHNLLITLRAVIWIIAWLNGLE